MKRKNEYILAGCAVLVFAIAGLLFFLDPTTPANSNKTNPLKGRTFYTDNTRAVKRLAVTYANDGKKDDAALLNKIAGQPNTTWLTGPHEGDSEANFDVAEVTRTSSAAAAQNKVAVYQLYAIPLRDACAGYSAAGFDTREQYLAWLDRVLNALQGDAVFSVEADAVAQAVRGNCLSDSQKAERYALLNEALRRMQNAPHVMATYLDAGQAEWLPDPNELVGPLKQAGIEHARGVAVNVSSFVSNGEIIAWSDRLTAAIGGNKGVLVDTSRNGQGVPPKDVTGDARWCNPSGRGIGTRPTTNTGEAHIDAFMYIKNIGESDGDCFGNPPAGTFVPSLALELARNARQ